jgi:hypothetical protein
MKGADRLARQLTGRRRRGAPLEPLFGRTAVVTATGGSGVTVDLDGVTAGPFSAAGSPSVGDTVFLIKKGDHYLVLQITP